MRQWRYGTVELTRKRKERSIHSHGYCVLFKPGHPLADSTGAVYEHRHVYYEANGDGPFNCFWCGCSLTWGRLHIDHLNNDKKDNHIDNLKASCPQCNQQRGKEKAKATWRKKTGIAYKGVIYSVSELADIVGISRQSMILRLKSMGVEDAVTKPRGKTGPKSNKPNQKRVTT
jgi:hypothetical protein